MIRSFGDHDTQRFFEGERAGFQGNGEQATLRLTLLDSAAVLEDLAGLPSYRLERGEQGGRHSIRINTRWQISFRWTPDGGPSEVKIVPTAGRGA